MLFNKLTLISIAAIIAIASILVFIIPTDSIETQSLINNETQSVINNETQSVINSEKSSINHTLFSISSAVLPRAPSYPIVMAMLKGEKKTVLYVLI